MTTKTTNNEQNDKTTNARRRFTLRRRKSGHSSRQTLRAKFEHISGTHKFAAALLEVLLLSTPQLRAGQALE